MSTRSRRKAARVARLSESGRRDLWDQVVDTYKTDPGTRHIILGHLLPFWGEHRDLLVPFVEGLLDDSDPRECIEASYLAVRMPEMLPKVLSTLRREDVCRQLLMVERIELLACALGHIDYPDLFTLESEHREAVVRQVYEQVMNLRGRQYVEQLELEPVLAWPPVPAEQTKRGSSD